MKKKKYTIYSFNFIFMQSFYFSMFKWLQTLALSHYSVLDPKYMRGSYNGIGKAKHLLEILNNTYKDKTQVNYFIQL